jgi:predicted PolB exonuclease-like 3'-5' exonuclease
LVPGNTLIWFNIKGFDLPFIIKRGLKYGIPVPPALQTFGKKPREFENMIDLYDVYRLMGRSSAGLGAVCTFLGLQSPKDEGIDWSQVQAYYDAGKSQDIIDYCIRDVHATIDVYHKFRELNVV